jgi:hypothetical protein
MVQEDCHSSQPTEGCTTFVDLQMTHHAEIQEKEKSWRTCPERPKDENKHNLCESNQLLEQCLSARNNDDHPCIDDQIKCMDDHRSTLLHNIKPGRSAFEICMEILAIFTSRLMSSSAQTFSSTTSQPVVECKLSSLVMPQESDV